MRPDIYLQADGRLGGVLGEMLNEIATKEGWKLKPHSCNWAECMALLQSGAIDLLPNVQHTPTRTQTLDFHQIPILSRSSQIYAAEGALLNSLEDLADKRIAILAGSAQYEALQLKLSQLQIHATLTAIQNLEDGFRLASNGAVDATVADYFFGALAAPRYRLSATPIVFHTSDMFYAAPKNQQVAVLTQIDAYLKNWKAAPDSIYYDVLGRWGHPQPAPLHRWYAHWGVLLSLTLLLLAAIAYAWHQRTRHLATQRYLLSKKEQFDTVSAVQENLQKQIQKTMEEQIQQAAFFDVLTGLPNRQKLVKRIRQAQAEVNTGKIIAAVIVLDVDNFHKINKAHGLAAGDRVLQDVARRLIAAVQDRDSVSRTNGDEFTILLTNLGESIDESTRKATKIAENLHRALTKEPLEVFGQHYRLCVSIGLTILERSEQTVIDILRKADIAAHRAKELGGNRIVLFDHDIQEKIEYHLVLAQDLALAIQSAQLHPHLQPQYAADGRVSGAELLARWSHPVHGPIPPSIFIPLARDRGLLKELTGLILTQACQIVLALRQQGEQYPVSLNISPETLADPLFIQTAHDILNDTPTAADHLIFEVTEEIEAHDMASTVQHMHELTAHGIRFSIDDFGTGYSNLASLNHLPIHELKIDKSLVAGIPHRDDSVAIIQLIITLAQKLNLNVVAEGVETQAQADFLFKHQCHAIQGYLVACPLSLEAWLEQRSAQAAPDPLA